ncbi:hypothetical protein [Devosia riboflavina]
MLVLTTAVLSANKPAAPQMAPDSVQSAHKHGILVVLQHQRQDLHHLAISGRLLEKVLLRRSEGIRQSAKGAPLRRAPGLRCTTAR